MVLFHLEGKIMKCSDFWKHVFVEFVELSIEVFSTIASPEIASHYSIWIQHWDDVKHEGSPQHLSDRFLREQILDETLDDERRMSLSWVDAPSYQHYFLSNGFTRS